MRYTPFRYRIQCVESSLRAGGEADLIKKAMHEARRVSEVRVEELDRDPPLLETSIDSLCEIDRGHASCANGAV